MAIKTYKKGAAIKLSENFKSNEFDCHGKNCCSTTKIDEKLLNYLQQIRDHFKAPVYISSAYRCDVHNKSVGGATASRHKEGKAADIDVNNHKPLEVAQYCESIGILGIGLYETDADGYFVHIDTRTTKSFWYGQKQEKRDTFQTEKTIDTSKVDTNQIKPQVIWNFLKDQGLSDYGVAGLMGNLYAESGLNPINMEDSYQKKLNMSDVEYTAAVDQKIYKKFTSDAVGYGLAQWTYSSRKQNMLNFHIKANQSIGHLETQLEFLVKELSTDFKSVWNLLKTTKSLEEASNAVLLKFERPADQSESMQKKRIEYGKKYLNEFGAINETEQPKEENPKEEVDLEKLAQQFKVGMKVRLLPGALFSTGAKIPDWVFNSVLYVRQIKRNGLIVFSTKSYGAITGITLVTNLEPDDTDATPVKPADDFSAYLVKVTASALNVRTGPGTQYKVVTCITKNQVYTIVAEKNGWGKLKSGAGWIHLDYVRKI